LQRLLGSRGNLHIVAASIEQNVVRQHAGTLGGRHKSDKVSVTGKEEWQGESSEYASHGSTVNYIQSAPTRTANITDREEKKSTGSQEDGAARPTASPRKLHSQDQVESPVAARYVLGSDSWIELFFPLAIKFSTVFSAQSLSRASCGDWQLHPTRSCERSFCSDAEAAGFEEWVNLTDKLRQDTSNLHVVLNRFSKRKEFSKTHKWALHVTVKRSDKSPSSIFSQQKYFSQREILLD